MNTYARIIGTITDIQHSNTCGQLLVSVNADEGPVTFAVSPKTYIADFMQLYIGQKAAFFYDTSLPVPLIYPPQYQAAAIAPIYGEEQVTLAYFNSNLTTSDNSLALQLSNETQVLSANGQVYGCAPGGNILMVFYYNTTRSIPPQTTPYRIIVFCV